MSESHQKSKHFAFSVTCSTNITLILMWEAFLEQFQSDLFKCAISNDYHTTATHILREAETSHTST